MKLGVARQWNVEPSLATLPDIEPSTLVPLWSRDWKLDRRLVKAIRARGAEPIVYLETTGYPLDRIIDGVYDCELRRLALAADESIVRPNQEPNGNPDIIPWALDPLWKPAQQRMATVMRAEADVRIAYSPVGRNRKRIAELEDWYPGDEFVDVLGFDYFSTDEDDRFPPDQWAVSVEWARSKGKSVYVFETGRKVGLSRRAEWLRSILDAGVDAAIVFDMTTPDQHAHQWGWSPKMRAAWREMLAA